MASNSNRVYYVGVLGGTGVVGQKFIYLLSKHKNFVLKKISASKKNAYKKYVDVTKWLIEKIDSNFLNDFVIFPTEPQFFTDCDFVFSALASDVADEIEKEFLSKGISVFSNAKSHRMDIDVPLLIPFVNSEHLDIIKNQKSYSAKEAFIVTNANCSTTGLSIALAPLQKAYGIRSVIVTTMQSISGAGYPGVPSLDIIDNIVPFIQDEEEKMKLELNKIYGIYDDTKIVASNIKVSASCNRVPVTNGHLLSVCVSLENREICKLDDISFIEEIKKVYQNFLPPKIILDLPSCPNKIIKLFEDNDRPQPKLDRNEGDGMTTCIGRLRRCEIFDLKFVILSHNTTIGAAGGSILNAELCAARDFFKKNTIVKK